MNWTASNLVNRRALIDCIFLFSFFGCIESVAAPGLSLVAVSGATLCCSALPIEVASVVVEYRL